MRYGTVQGINKPVSRLVQGTLAARETGEEGTFQLLDQVYELGCNVLDTGRIYGDANEMMAGKWVRTRGLRDKIVMIGKGAHHSSERKRVTPQDITDDINKSLECFEFDYIDLYLLHRDDPSVPVGPIVEVLNEHHKAGKILAFGGSNWSHERIAEANAYAKAHNLVPFAASSPNYSLAEQFKPPWADCITISGPQGEAARQWYAATQMPIFAWSSLAGGFFSGRFSRENLEDMKEGYDKLAAESYGYEPNFERLDRVRALAEEKGMTIPQIAMAYVMSQPLNIFALVGCRNKAEFEANAAAADLKLSDNELAWLDLRRDER